jgi:putative endonuclease
MRFYIYITTNPNKTVLYTGLTNNLYRRIREHYENRGQNDSFAGKYYCYHLLHFEEFTEINTAIQRENEIKNMSREAKYELIQEGNPTFFSLNKELFGLDWMYRPLSDENISDK